MKNTKKIAAMAAALTLAVFSTPNNITSSLDSLPTPVMTTITAEAKTTYDVCYPVIDPVITSGYGYRTLNNQKEFHQGIDFVSSSKNKNVYAITDCKVIEVYNKCRVKKNFAYDYGNYIKFLTSDGRLIIYGHLDPDAICVKVGDNVKAGDLVCTNYSCYGAATGDHLHLEIRPSKSAKYGNSINVNPVSKGGTMNYHKIVKTETTDTLVNGKTYILYAGGSDKTICVTATGKTNKSNIKAAKYSKGNKMQQWIAMGSGNSWKFKNVATGKVIDFCVTNVSNIKNGTNVHLYDVSTSKVLSATQTVKPILVKSGKSTYYKFAVTGNTKYVLDFYGSVASASSNLQLWQDNGSLTQYLILKTV